MRSSTARLGTNSPTDGTSSRRHAPRCASRTRRSSATRKATPGLGAADDVARNGCLSAVGAIETLEQSVGVVADELDERSHATRQADVVNVENEHDDAHDNEEEGHHDGKSRYRVGPH